MCYNTVEGRLRYIMVATQRLINNRDFLINELFVSDEQLERLRLRPPSFAIYIFCEVLLTRMASLHYHYEDQNRAVEIFMVLQDQVERCDRMAYHNTLPLS